VKFVYKTAEIEEPESNETPVVEAVADSENSGFRVLGWIRSVWNKAANTHQSFILTVNNIPPAMPGEYCYVIVPAAWVNRQ
jgi:hypothetical protein